MQEPIVIRYSSLWHGSPSLLDVAREMVDRLSREDLIDALHVAMVYAAIDAPGSYDSTRVLSGLYRMIPGVRFECVERIETETE